MSSKNLRLLSCVAGAGITRTPPATAHDLLEQAEAACLEMRGDVADLQRVAQIGLVAAVFQHRFGIGDARELAGRRHALAVREFLEHRPRGPARSSWNTSSCVTKLISKSSW